MPSSFPLSSLIYGYFPLRFTDCHLGGVFRKEYIGMVNLQYSAKICVTFNINKKQHFETFQYKTLDILEIPRITYYV